MKSGLLRFTLVAQVFWQSSRLFAATHGDPSALAPFGGMDSGGAGLYGTDMNPWFLENTPVVTYCLDSNPNAFHQSLEKVDRIILDAVMSWRKVFADTKPEDRVAVQPYGVLRIATQKFKRIPCGDNVDVRFQLGTLTEEQKNQLGNYRQWIGATYRTGYDPKNLKGQGFVYIAADSGPERPISADLVTDVWNKCDGCLLQRTIVHELGHVFGMGHIGNDWDIMSERHLEKVTSQEWYSKHLSTSETLSFFKERSSLAGYLSFPHRYSAKDCSMLAGDKKAKLRRIFDIPDSEQCISFIRGRTSGCGIEQTIFAHHDSAYNRYFTADECKDAGRSEIGWLYLPLEQTVLKFPNGKATPVKVPIAVAYERTICSGSVYQFNGDKTPISMSIITSRDGVFAGAAFEPNTDRPEIFSSSMD